MMIKVKTSAYFAPTKQHHVNNVKAQCRKKLKSMMKKVMKKK